MHHGGHYQHHHGGHHRYNLKRPMKDGGTEDDDILEIKPIGSGNEVGRSCVLLKYKGKTIMFDCGVHPAYTGLSSLPFFDDVDASEIDLLLVSHFHLDHAAAVPYFVEKTDFKGRVFMTHPTRSIYKLILSDYVKVSNISVDEVPFNEQDLNSSLERIEQIRYLQMVEHNGIKFCCYNAGHVLGAAMFWVEIAGVRILYTGDFSRQEDRHLMGAQAPPGKVDVLIIESTYGVQVHEPRLEREKRFTGSIHEVVKRGGRCLIPVFALGRAQELLLILDEYWISHPELQHVPIYYASALASRSMKTYQTYINMMNDRIRAQFDVSNPFNFKYISNIQGAEDFDDNGPCVFMASPGMLQSGLSRLLFERWCTDKRNGVVIPGYSVEGTLAQHILSSPAEITRLDGVNVPLNLSVSYVSFSAHSDFLQTSEFIQTIQPPHIVLVHGDANEMSRLKHSLVAKFKTISVMTPKNTQKVQIEFKAEKIAKTLGSISAKAPKAGDVLSGILVTKDFIHHIVAPSDLHTYTNLKTNVIKQKQVIPFEQKYHLLYSTLEQIYDDIVEEEQYDINAPAGSNTKPVIHIYNEIKLTYNLGVSIHMEWNSNPVNDMISDSIIAVILQIESNPLSLKVRMPEHNLEDIKEELPLSKQEHDKEAANDDDIVEFRVKCKKSKKLSQKIDLVGQVKNLLQQQYGDMKPDENDPLILHFNSLDSDHTALIYLDKDFKVECLDKQLLTRLEDSIQRIKSSVHPISNINVNKLKQQERQQQEEENSTSETTDKDEKIKMEN
ncbi:hypothetical protein CYY_009201 [Polysphondylium violaceum]|uniref:Beta-lactamase domain-containing protein n=1 Tax=Polysphondylium violaceum TaxID=133409 RepID=A0A8J4V377_9MYCE|nr:hypothetical protein CYY_009201 [Polysphondylium violaceum]